MLLTLNGTGTNILALATMLQPGESVLCTDWSHINDDEAAAQASVKHEAHLNSLCRRQDERRLNSCSSRSSRKYSSRSAGFSPSPKQPSGERPSVDEIGELCEVAHSYGMVHLDGARIANAVAALGLGTEGLRKMVVETGVDTMSFGGTKNGLMAAEAVIHLTVPKIIGPAPPQTGQSTGIKDALCRYPVSRRPSRRPVACLGFARQRNGPTTSQRRK